MNMYIAITIASLALMMLSVRRLRGCRGTLQPWAEKYFQPSTVLLIDIAESYLILIAGIILGITAFTGGGA